MAASQVAARKASGGKRLSIDEAVALIRGRPPVPDAEPLAVTAALGRVLAEDIVADAPVPAHESSAMDGYAVRFADVGGDRRLRISARVAAGHPCPTGLAPGEAARVFTGAALPPGADTVAMQEYCRLDGDSVILPPDLVPGANRRHAGEDIAAGTTVLAAGSRLRPQDIGMAAAVGRASLRVRRRLRIGLLVTGDELRRPGAPLPPGCIYDSNRHTVGAALRSLGAEVSDYGIVPDNRAAIRDALSVAAASNDLVVSTGGMSEGEEDHVRAAVQEIGSLDFWKLPIKPGSPVAIGDAADAAFLGLPGNPVAAMITFWLLGRPLVLHLMGAADLAPARFPVIALFDHQHRPGRREFLRARLRAQAGGRLGAETFGSTGSGMLSSLTWSDGLIELSEDTGDVAAGDIVSYLPYHGLE